MLKSVNRTLSSLFVVGGGGIYESYRTTSISHSLFPKPSNEKDFVLFSKHRA